MWHGQSETQTHNLNTKEEKNVFYARAFVLKLHEGIATATVNINGSLRPKRLLGVSMFVVWLYK